MTNRAAVARTIALQLGHIIDKADQAGLVELGDLLNDALAEAERQGEAKQGSSLQG